MKDQIVGSFRHHPKPKCIAWIAASATLETERTERDAKTAGLRRLRAYSEWLVRDDLASMRDQIDCSALL